jgi:hypothetical protein
MMKKRNYELYAATEYDRQMWMYAFDYLIKSSKVVTDIIKESEADEKKE